MALELFKPFHFAASWSTVVLATHQRSCEERWLSGELPEVWDILADVNPASTLLLNVAPTLSPSGGIPGVRAGAD